MITLFHGSDKIIERLHMKQYAAWLMLFTAPRMIACPKDRNTMPIFCCILMSSYPFRRASSSSSK